MADFPEFILFTLICAAIATLSVLGGVAFRRTSRLRDALAIAEERIRYLEDALNDIIAQGVSPAAPQRTPAPIPAPITDPVAPPARAAFAPAAQPQAQAYPREPWLAKIEKAIASNWLVWIGGGFIALAIVFILRFAIDEGWFGPPAQLAGAYLLGAGLIAGAEYMRRRPPADAASQLRNLPAILSAAGLFALFAATYAGNANFFLIPTALAFVLLALCALAAIMLSLRYGPWLAALGLGGGYLAPALVPFDNPAPAALFGYVLALTAAALAIIKLRRWRGFVWLAAGGALVWGVAWLLFATPGGEAEAAFYLVALAGIGIVFGWGEAGVLPAWRDIWRFRTEWNESVFAAHALFASSAIVLLLLSVQTGAPLIAAAILALCALTAVIASVREGFSLMPLGAAAIAIVSILLWPVTQTGAPAYIGALMQLDGALGFVFSGGGWLMMARNQRAGYGAVLAALGPIAVVAATHETAPLLLPGVRWAVAALILAGINAFALERLARGMPVDDRGSGPVAAFTLGAAAALTFAVYFAMHDSGLWLSAALAILIPIMAHLDLRFKLPALRGAIATITAVVTWRLIFGFEALNHPLNPTPFFNQLIPGYALPALCLWGAGWLYRRGGMKADTRLVELLEVTALIVAVAGISYEARHLATGGNLRAPGASLIEIGLDASAWLALVIGLAVRFGPEPRRVIFYAEGLLAIAAGALLLVFAGLTLNPWWGEIPSLAPGWPIFNALLITYGAPAALLAIYAIIKRRQDFGVRAEIAGAAATVLAFVNITLEIRRSFHGPDMAGEPILQWEAWSYTAAWTVFAGVLLALGLMRHKPSLRYASLAVLLAAIIKAFGFDMSALTGVLRALSYLGLGATIIAVALIYQRYVFPRAAKTVS